MCEIDKDGATIIFIARDNDAPISYHNKAGASTPPSSSTVFTRSVRPTHFESRPFPDVIYRHPGRVRVFWLDRRQLSRCSKRLGDACGVIDQGSSIGVSDALCRSFLVARDRSVKTRTTKNPSWVNIQDNRAKVPKGICRRHAGTYCV